MRSDSSSPIPRGPLKGQFYRIQGVSKELVLLLILDLKRKVIHSTEAALGLLMSSKCPPIPVVSPYTLFVPPHSLLSPVPVYSHPKTIQKIYSISSFQEYPFGPPCCLASLALWIVP